MTSVEDLETTDSVLDWFRAGWEAAVSCLNDISESEDQGDCDAAAMRDASLANDDDCDTEIPQPVTIERLKKLLIFGDPADKFSRYHNPAGDDRRDQFEALGVLCDHYREDCSEAVEDWADRGGLIKVVEQFIGDLMTDDALVERAHAIFYTWLSGEIDVEQARLDAITDQIDANIRATCAAIESALGLAYTPIDDHRFRGRGSKYTNYRGLSLRVSDHLQKPGGGWCEERQEQHGDCDLQWVVGADSVVPSRSEIRARVATELKGVAR